MKVLFTEVTWSERPVWVSPPLQGTRFRKGKHVNRLWTDAGLKRLPEEALYLGLGSIDVSHIRDRPSSHRFWPTEGPSVYTAEGCRAFLGQCLGLPSFESLEPYRNEGLVLRLDLAITEMTPGYGLFDGWWHTNTPLDILNWTSVMGLGDARVQVEGVLSEPEHNRALLKCVVRRRAIRRWPVEKLVLDPLPWPEPEPGMISDAFAKSIVGLLLRRTAYDLIMELDHRVNKSAA